MTGTELTTFITGLNGGATIDPTLLAVLCQSAQAIIEEEREWMVLRKTDSSLTVTTANTWLTAKSLAGITDFSRFYGNYPVQLFESASNRIEYYQQASFDRRLEFKDVSSTFVFDENANTIYLNGLVPFAGTLYSTFISSSTLIDPTSAAAIWSVFPARFAPLIGFYAVGIFKGAVDYDTINAMMLPENRAVMTALKNALEKWDNSRQLAAIEHNDPSEADGSYPRSGAINTHD